MIHSQIYHVTRNSSLFYCHAQPQVKLILSIADRAYISQPSQQWGGDDLAHTCLTTIVGHIRQIFFNWNTIEGDHKWPIRESCFIWIDCCELWVENSLFERNKLLVKDTLFMVCKIIFENDIWPRLYFKYKVNSMHIVYFRKKCTFRVKNSLVQFTL